MISLSMIAIWSIVAATVLPRQNFAECRTERSPIAVDSEYRILLKKSGKMRIVCDKYVNIFDYTNKYEASSVAIFFRDGNADLPLVTVNNIKSSRKLVVKVTAILQEKNLDLGKIKYGKSFPHIVILPNRLEKLSDNVKEQGTNPIFTPKALNKSCNITQKLYKNRYITILHSWSNDKVIRKSCIAYAIFTNFGIYPKEENLNYRQLKRLAVKLAIFVLPDIYERMKLEAR